MKETMKACVLHGVGDLRVDEVKVPELKNGEVMIKIKASGICGSDIARVLTKGTYHFPTIPGHEFSGEIVGISEGLDKELVGKKATVFPLLPCGKCSACQIGEYASCSDYNYFGSRCDGGFAEYIAVPLWNVCIAPDSLTYEEIAMTEPAAVAIHTLRQAGIEIGDNIVIFGAGPIGLMLANWARAWGADKVILTDIDKSKIAFAKEQGFSDVINSLETDPVEKVFEMTGGRGADIAIEGAGVSITLEQCLKATRAFGKVVAMGNPAGDMALSQKGYWELMRKQLTLTGTWNSSYVDLPKNDWQLALRAMETGKINVKPFVTHRVTLDDGIEPFKMMQARETFFNKVMYILED